MRELKNVMQVLLVPRRRPKLYEMRATVRAGALKLAEELLAHSQVTAMHAFTGAGRSPQPRGGAALDPSHRLGRIAGVRGRRIFV